MIGRGDNLDKKGMTAQLGTLLFSILNVVGNMNFLETLTEFPVSFVEKKQKKLDCSTEIPSSSLVLLVRKNRI